MPHPANSPLPGIWITRRREEPSLSSRSSTRLLRRSWLPLQLVSSPVLLLLTPLSLLSLLSVHDQKHQRCSKTDN